MTKILLFLHPVALFVGLFVILVYSCWFIYWILNYVRCLVFSKKLKHYGKTAIVTGCTSGIGRAITYELIREGVDLLLISRNEEELSKLKNDLLEKNSQFKGVIDTVTFDFNTSDFSSYKKIQEKVKSMDIGILINNVGQSYPNPLFYDEMDEELVSQLVNVNLLSSYFMTKLVLPGMKEKKKGLILFVSTGSSVIKSCPLLTIYASVKSAINSFATSLSVELRQYHINVHCHVPLFVTTKLSKIKRTSLFVPSPEVYAKTALKQIKRGNIISTNVISSPYCYHKIQTFLFNLAPKFLCDSFTLQLHKKLRALALRKMKKSE